MTRHRHGEVSERLTQTQTSPGEQNGGNLLPHKAKHFERNLSKLFLTLHRFSISLFTPKLLVTYLESHLRQRNKNETFVTKTGEVFSSVKCSTPKWFDYRMDWWGKSFLVWFRTSSPIMSPIWYLNEYMCCPADPHPQGARMLRWIVCVRSTRGEIIKGPVFLCVPGFVVWCSAVSVVIVLCVFLKVSCDVKFNLYRIVR